ncbi:MAG: glycine betaine ABC transporter substrate-binding protein [Actinomycetota bacterium]|nr:glycine betaine ABC transporter substrate-binding protein [Actinomycetota bacterium]
MFKKFNFLLVLFLLFTFVVAFTFTGCTSPKEEVIKIGSQTYSEPKIIAEMVKALIEENTDLKVEHISGLAASATVHEAMLNNEIQLSVRYTGTEFAGSLGKTEIIRDKEEVYKIVKEEFKKRWNQEWFPQLGFENTYCLAVKNEFAEENNILKISDLMPVANNLRLACDTTWLERPIDGYPAFIDWYGMEFKKVFSMEIALTYEAIRNDQVEVICAYSTDSKIKSYDLKVLEDDKNFFPPYDCAVVAKIELLDKYPELREVIGKLSGLITPDDMIDMNYKADELGIDHSQIAREFLEERGLI